MFDQSSDRSSGSDHILNAETRRALRRRGRQVGMLVAGAVVAIVIFGVAGLAAILSVPWQLSLAVTVGATVAVPVAVPYAMLRVWGLSHRDVLYVGKRAFREAATEVIALSGTQETADVFTGSIAIDEETENSPPENGERDSITDESAESDMSGSRTQHTQHGVQQ